MKKNILYWFGILLILSIILQFLWLDGFDITDLKGLNINIMVSLLFTLVTVFIIDKLVQIHESQKRLNDYLSTLKLTHKQFVNRIARKYTQIIIKEPKEIDAREVLENLESYIDQDFVRKKIKVSVLNPNSIFESKQVETDYFKFCTEFKKSIESEITLFLNRYAAVIPPEVMTHILRIDNLLKSNMLVSPADYGINDFRIDINTVGFDPKDYIDVFTSLGNEIVALQKYSQ